MRVFLTGATDSIGSHIIPELLAHGHDACDIADAIGQGTGLPVRSVAADEVDRYFGWMAPFAGLDMATSNDWTWAKVGWAPTGPNLLTDLAAMNYSFAAQT